MRENTVVNSSRKLFNAEQPESPKRHFADNQPISVWPNDDQLLLGANNADFGVGKSFPKLWLGFENSCRQSAVHRSWM